MAIRNLFSEAMQNYDSAYEREKAFSQDMARKRAGRALTAGSAQEAQASLNNAGLLDEGRQIQSDQDAQGDRQFKQADQTLGVLKSVAQGLQSVPEGPARWQEFQRISPIFSQIGLPPQMMQALGQVTPDMLSDAGLQSFGATLDDQIKVLNTSAGVVAADMRALSRDINDPAASRLLYEDPYRDDLMQARIDATRAQSEQRRASAGASNARAAKTRAAPAGGRGGGGVSSGLPAGGTWERF